MNWSMPRPVLQVVAASIGAVCLGSFAMGVMTAQPPARLPGEQPGAAAGQPIEAQEARPLTEERIEGAPQPPPLTDEQKAQIEADKVAKEAEAAAAKIAAEKAAGADPAAAAQAPPDRIGEALEKAAPKPPPPKVEEPPF